MLRLYNYYYYCYRYCMHLNLCIRGMKVWPSVYNNQRSAVSISESSRESRVEWNVVVVIVIVSAFNLHVIAALPLLRTAAAAAS